MTRFGCPSSIVVVVARNKIALAAPAGMLGSAKVAGQLSSNRGTSGTSSSNSPMTSFLRVFRRFVSNYLSERKLPTWSRKILQQFQDSMVGGPQL